MDTMEANNVTDDSKVQVLRLRTTTFQNIVVLTEYLVVLTPKKNVWFILSCL